MGAQFHLVRLSVTAKESQNLMDFKFQLLIDMVRSRFSFLFFFRKKERKKN